MWIGTYRSEACSDAIAMRTEQSRDCAHKSPRLERTESTLATGPVDRGSIRDAWDDDTKDRFASLSLSRMLPMEVKPRSSVRGSEEGDIAETLAPQIKDYNNLVYDSTKENNLQRLSGKQRSRYICKVYKFGSA
ncbi:hypothetical protein RB195_000271 [Necator americanus]|uniref:Uncharacterized protein n=1 Tax=Necator americanus TaxID=51031 RepID=A0ABR1D8V1_NECAM